MPKNVDELLEVARAFTLNDPDGNGENDTYAFTAAGAGQNVNDLRYLTWFFGANGVNFYNDNGTVENAITDGKFKEYLDFCRTIVSEGLIDPDWYTQGWNDRKPNLFQGKFGIVWYPPQALLLETNSGRDNDNEVATWYDHITMDGLNYSPPSILGMRRSVSESCGNDAAKMDIIINFLEDTALPSDSYWKIRFGVEIDNYVQVDMGGGYVYINYTDTSEPHAFGYAPPGNYGLANWGKLVYAPGETYLHGSEKEPDDFTNLLIDYNMQWAMVPKFDADYMLLNPDPTLAEESKRIIDEFEISYILGNTDDYDGFVAAWRAGAGDELIEDATKTFQYYGIID